MIKKIAILSLLISFIVPCQSQTQSQTIIKPSRTIDSAGGVPLEILQIAGSGPAGFTPDLFPRSILKSAGVNGCEITSKTDTSARVTKKAWFDKNGNKILENDFSFWGWASDYYPSQGTNIIIYNDVNNMIQSKSILPSYPKDTVLSITNYTKKGWLYSKEVYAISGRKNKGWEKVMEIKYFYSPPVLIIETTDEGKTSVSKDSLTFDASGRLASCKKYSDKELVGYSAYVYDGSTITATVYVDEMRHALHAIRVKLDKKKRPVEKIVYNNNGSVAYKGSITYNGNGLIEKIEYGSFTQLFNYTY